MIDELKNDPLADLLLDFPKQPDRPLERSTPPPPQIRKTKSQNGNGEKYGEFDAIKLKDKVLAHIEYSFSQNDSDTLTENQQQELQTLVDTATAAHTPHKQRENLETLRTRLGAEVLKAAEYKGTGDLSRARAPLHALELLLESDDVELAKALFLLYHETYNPVSFNLSKKFDPLPTLTNVNNIRMKFAAKKKKGLVEDDTEKQAKKRAQSLLDELAEEIIPSERTQATAQEHAHKKESSLDRALRTAENFLLEKGWPAVQREILFSRLEHDLDTMHDADLLAAFTRPPTEQEHADLLNQQGQLQIRLRTQLAGYFSTNTPRSTELSSLLVTNRHLQAVTETLSAGTENREHLSLGATDLRALAYITLEKRLSEKLSSLQRRVKGISDPDTHEKTLNQILDDVTRLCVTYDSEIQKIKQGYLRGTSSESLILAEGSDDTQKEDEFEKALSGLKPKGVKQEVVPATTSEKKDAKKGRTALEKINSGMYILEQVMQMLSKQALEAVMSAQESKVRQATLDDLL